MSSSANQKAEFVIVHCTWFILRSCITSQLCHSFFLFRNCEEASSEKWLLEKQQLLEEHEKTVAASSKKLQELEARVERYKAEERRNKQKLGESEEEIGRLDSTLNETQESLDESEKVRARLEKELGKVADLNRKVPLGALFEGLDLIIWER